VVQWEREAISERTAFALAHKRQNGQAYSRTPFGYDRKGDLLIPNPIQQHALKMAKRMAAKGASLRQIAITLTKKGITPPRGRKWHASGVRAVLNSKIASGQQFQAGDQFSYRAVRQLGSSCGFQLWVKLVVSFAQHVTKRGAEQDGVLCPSLDFERFFDRLIFRPRRAFGRELFYLGLTQLLV
jgi:Recombinase